MKRILNLLLLVFFSAAVLKSENVTNFRSAVVLAYSPVNSVVEDENIKVQIYDGRVWVVNKSNKTMYIDYSQCFLNNNGVAYPITGKYLGEDQASQKSYTTSIDEFMSIAPSMGMEQKPTFICRIENDITAGVYNSSEKESSDFSERSIRFIEMLNEMVNESLMKDPKGKQYLGSSHRHLTEDESVSNIGVNIAYSFNKRAEEWTNIAISTWVCDVYFAPYYVEMPVSLNEEKRRGFGVKKTDSAIVYIKADSPYEYDEEKNPIMIYDWSGDFKTGKFSFRNVNIRLEKKVGNQIRFTPLKNKLYFSGKDDNWGKMQAFKLLDFSKFNNPRKRRPTK